MFLGGGTMDDNQLKLVLNDPLLGPATHNPEVWLWCIIHEAEHVSEEKSLQKNSSEGSKQNKTDDLANWEHLKATLTVPDINKPLRTGTVKMPQQVLEQLPVLTSVLDLDKFDSGKYKKQTTITSSK